MEALAKEMMEAVAKEAINGMSRSAIAKGKGRKHQPRGELRVEFTRNGTPVSAAVDYPPVPPTSADVARLAQEAKKLYCPGCTNDDVVLERCHCTALVKHLGLELPIEGMQTPRSNDQLIELIDGDGHVFVGRRPPRGLATKSIGVKTTLVRSKFANPFIVSARNFKLGESLALYVKWIEGGYAPLALDVLQATVNGAPRLPETLEELVKERPDLFA